jgi:hypothetical protein
VLTFEADGATFGHVALPAAQRNRPLSYMLFAGLLASSQYPEGPALTGHLGTGFFGFPGSKSEC